MLGIQWSSNNASSLLVPYVVDALQLMWVDPWFEGLFVLPFFFVTDCDRSYEHIFWKYYDIFVVACTLVVVWSSGQRVSLAVRFPRDVTYLEIKLH